MTNILSKTVICMMIVLLAAAGACSKGKPPAGVLKGFENLAQVKKSGELEKFYTADTVGAAKKYNSKNNADILMGYDRKIFDKGSEIETINEAVSGKNALVRIRILKHPQTNMIGLVMDIKMTYENGRWKIDRYKEIKNLL